MRLTNTKHTTPEPIARKTRSDRSIMVSHIISSLLNIVKFNNSRERGGGKRAGYMQPSIDLKPPNNMLVCLYISIYLKKSKQGMRGGVSFLLSRTSRVCAVNLQNAVVKSSIILRILCKQLFRIHSGGDDDLLFVEKFQ